MPGTDDEGRHIGCRPVRRACHPPGAGAEDERLAAFRGFQSPARRVRVGVADEEDGLPFVADHAHGQAIRAGIEAWDQDRRVAALEPGLRWRNSPEGWRDGVAHHPCPLARQPENLGILFELPLADEGKAGPGLALAREFEGLHRWLVVGMMGPHHQRLRHAQVAQVSAIGFIGHYDRVGAVQEILGQRRFMIEAFHAQIAAGLRGVGEENDRMAKLGEFDRKIGKPRFRTPDRLPIRRLDRVIDNGSVNEDNPHV